MEKPHITFVHGWGCGPDIWEPVARLLHDCDHRYVDLGFTGAEDNTEYCDSKTSIYVTHSLGTLWALKYRANHMRSLIAVNGFTHFAPFADRVTLKAMRRNLKQDINVQMTAFWDRAGLPHSDVLHYERLDEGLIWLMDWDYTDELQALSCPIHALIGTDDLILDCERAQAHWQSQTLVTCAGGEHSLPLSHPDFCAMYIREVADDL